MLGVTAADLQEYCGPRGIRPIHTGRGSVQRSLGLLQQRCRSGSIAHQVGKPGLVGQQHSKKPRIAGFSGSVRAIRCKAKSRSAILEAPLPLVKQPQTTSRRCKQRLLRMDHCPFPCRAHVLAIALDLAQRLDLPRAGEVTLACGKRPEVVGRVLVACGLLLGRVGGKLLRRVLPQQLVDAVAVARGVVLEQRPADKAVELAQRRACNSLNRAARAAAAEDRQPRERATVDSVEPLPGRVEDRAHVPAVACGHVPGGLGLQHASRSWAISPAIIAMVRVSAQPAASSIASGMPPTSRQIFGHIGQNPRVSRKVRLRPRYGRRKERDGVGLSFGRQSAEREQLLALQVQRLAGRCE